MHCKTRDVFLDSNKKICLMLRLPKVSPQFTIGHQESPIKEVTEKLGALIPSGYAYNNC